MLAGWRVNCLDWPWMGVRADAAVVVVEWLPIDCMLAQGCCCCCCCCFCCCLPRTRGNLSWGVADITEAGMGGIVAGWVGCFASRDASIRFFSQSGLGVLPVPLALLLLAVEVTCEPSIDRFTATLRSPSSTGLFWPELMLTLRAPPL